MVESRGRDLRVSFYLLLHVDELALLVVELILQEGKLLGGDDAEAHAILQLPLALEREQPLVDVGGYVGMDVQIEFADANLVD